MHDRNTLMMTTKKSVAIVGAGASGIVAAKILSDDGFNVTIFERRTSLGGTWNETMAYLHLHTQQPGGTMEFSDLSDGTEYGTWEHTNDYLNRYADEFRIRERIHFNSRVVSIEKDDLTQTNLPWMITVEVKNGSIEIYYFHFLIIATGIHSEPHIINIPGQEKFAGPIIHPCSVKTKDQLVDKRVAIIGGGKSATDMATLAGLYARSCHLIFRRAHWSLPSLVMGGRLSAKYILTRANSFLFGPSPIAPHTYFFRFLHKQFPNIFKKIIDQVTKDVIAINGPDLYDDEIFLPQISIRNDANLSMIPNDFIRLKREGRIIGKLATIDTIIDQTTIKLDTGEQLSIDLIIVASGYRLRFPFFSDQLLGALGLHAKNDLSITEGIDLNLYRWMIPIDVPNIAFLGFTMSIGQWMLNEVSSHWISDYFLGRLKLPNSKRAMQDEIDMMRTFASQTYNQDVSTILHFWVAAIDTLLNDMGVDMHRTNNWIMEYFSVYRPERFKTLHEERRKKAEGKSMRRWYFSFKHNLILVFVCILSLVVLFF